MAAAEYYGYNRDKNNGGGNNYGGEQERMDFGQPQWDSSSERPYNNNPYASTQDDLTSYSSPVDTSYQPHPIPHRESTSSVATHSKQYSDPYAENIPLASRPIPGASETPPEIVPPVVKKKKGFFGGRRKPWFCWIMTMIQIGVFIGELARNATLTGSPIATKPNFNPMIGPSPYVQIVMGGRYVLCMKHIPSIWKMGSVNFPCPSTTTNEANCTLAQHCGFSGVPTEEEMRRPDNPKGPNQWYRFILPIFLHAGLIHIAFNMLLQLRLGADMERDIGPLRFGIVYFASGIFGFILGGNFAPNGIVSTGASGCLFGVLALVLLDLFYTWNDRAKPWKDLGFLGVSIIISFALGLLPGLDNFAHIGGFVMGIMLGLTVLHSPDILRRKIGIRGGGLSDPPYSPVTAQRMKYEAGATGPGKQEIVSFVKDPVGFFKGRKPMWWAWWLVRAGMLALAVIATSLLLQSFYGKEIQCSWCRYLSCLPVHNWCDIGYLEIRNQTTNEQTPNPALLFLH